MAGAGACWRCSSSPCCCCCRRTWFAGRVDRIPLPPGGGQIAAATFAGALRSAFARAPFVVMTAAYFVCGMQLLFIATHLPSYLAICGMDPMLSAQALGVIALFNVAGSLFFGWAGGHWPKLVLLGGIYVARSLVLGWYFMAPPTPASTLVFAALMGFLWLGVGPLVAGSARWHSHDESDEFFYVLSGLFHLDTDDRTIDVRAGELFVVPAGVRHRGRAEARTTLLVIDRI
jgi:mannose-6-phosphate isomerase-like protein (cupin superfamily)